MPWLWAYRPVRKETRAGQQRGVVANARVNAVPWEPNHSSVRGMTGASGISRWSSVTMRRMFGLPADEAVGSSSRAMQLLAIREVASSTSDARRRTGCDALGEDIASIIAVGWRRRSEPCPDPAAICCPSMSRHGRVDPQRTSVPIDPDGPSVREQRLARWGIVVVVAGSMVMQLVLIQADRPPSWDEAIYV